MRVRITRGKPFEAAQKEWRNPSRDWRGWCLVFVRTCYDVPAGVRSAADSWRMADHKHPTSDPHAIPRGVPVFWLGGSHGFGHIAVSAGGGMCWSTDLRRPGKVDKVPIDDVRRLWGLQLAGWAEEVNGQRVVELVPDPAPRPAPAARRPEYHNHVTAARELIDQAVELLRQTPASRAVCHRRADELVELLDRTPAR